VSVGVNVPGTMVSDGRSTGTSVQRSIFNAVYPCVVFQSIEEYTVFGIVVCRSGGWWVRGHPLGKVKQVSQGRDIPKDQ